MNPDTRAYSPFIRSIGRIVFIAVVLLAAVSPRTVMAQSVPPLPASVTYVLPSYGGFGLSDAEFAVKVADLKQRLAPNGEGQLVRVGFAAFIFISMDDWNVDTSNPAAVRAALAGTISQIENVVAKGVTHNIPVCLSFQTAIRERYDPAQTASELADRRTMQWWTDNGMAGGWWTHSQYARKQLRVKEAYLREVSKVVAGYMSRYPNIVVAASGDGEVELSYGPAFGNPDWPFLADYSPFAVAEFRDWLRGAGLYAAGQPLAGQGYANSARYAGDGLPGEDRNGDGHTLNGDFGLAFTSWNLRYADWSLADNPDADPNAIPASVYNVPGWAPPDNGAAFFDAPRVRADGNPWWEAWIRFRQEMIWRSNRDFAKWMTTSADPVTGATIPAERWYSDQIPTDFLFGNPPPDGGLRLRTSASPWWTADVSPYGSLGITSYNVHQVDPSNGAHYYFRTLVNVAPVIAARKVPWGILEWNPSVPPTTDPTVYRDEMEIVERYRPSLLVPFFWGDALWQVQDTPFESELRGLISRLKGPTMAADQPSLRFNAIRNQTITGPQKILLSQAGTGGVNWTATSNRSWLLVSPASGTGPGQLTIHVNPTDAGLQGIGTFTARVSVSSPQATNTTTIDVTVSVSDAGTTVAPFGQIDTPVQNASGVVGAIAVTGWALDDMGVTGVKIYRNCLPFDNPLSCQVIGGAIVVFVGDAAFLAGARPDVEATFPGYPQGYRAGWGYLLLTNMLPHVTNRLGYGGQGPLQLYAFATDVEGRVTLLGRATADHTPTSITMANDSIAKPFGAIDTPGQGETVNGSVVNFGWALTPDSDTTAGAGDILVPLTGSTMVVYVDGVALGTVGYNQCRGTVGNPVPAESFCNDDVANIFGNVTPQPSFTKRDANPTKFRNLDASRAAIGAFMLDTTRFTSGLHTLAWGVTDSAGRADGIGSRYFTVLNSPSDAGPPDAVSGTPMPALFGRPAARIAAPMVADSAATVAARGNARDLADLAPARDAVWGRIGFDPGTAVETVPADAAGGRHVQLAELGRLELWLGAVETGYLVANGTLRDLPTGSTLDAAAGRFTWMPGPGYVGTYHLVFVRGGEQIAVFVTIRPVAAAATGESAIRMHVDLPQSGQTVSGLLTVAGWALDPQAGFGSGIGMVHVWAQRRDVPAGPEFLGAAALGGERPDVAAAHGSQFGRAGFGLTTTVLAPGHYDITAYAWSRRTARWEDARTVTVTVR